MKPFFRNLGKTIIIVVVIGYLLPQGYRMPVDKAPRNSYEQNSYWYYPWGKSITHKGVDIFAKKGTKVCAATSGIVLFQGEINRGGKVVLVLGPKCRLHYYAHLESIHTSTCALVSRQTEIGRVGNTGNAKGKPPHLHYAILTLFPYIWRIDNSVQGWKKMFYLNPIEFLNTTY